MSPEDEWSSYLDKHLARPPPPSKRAKANSGSVAGSRVGGVDGDDDDGADGGGGEDGDSDGREKILFSCVFFFFFFCKSFSFFLPFWSGFFTCGGGGKSLRCSGSASVVWTLRLWVITNAHGIHTRTLFIS